VAAVYVVTVVGVWQWVDHSGESAMSHSPLALHPAPARSAAEEERCQVPEFAKRIGHEEMWKRHNNCL
jgi:hypothetical protein